MSSATIDVLDVKTGARKTVVRGGTYGRYLPSGHLIYVNSGTLFAVRFDLERLETSGTPIAILDDMSYSSIFGYAQVDFSSDGTLAYRRSTESGWFFLQWLDADGKSRTLLDLRGRYEWLRLSPDGERAAFTLQESDHLPAAGTPDWRQLAQNGALMIPWSFSPDGRRLAYYTMSRNTALDLWTAPVETTAGGLRAGDPEPFRRTPAFEIYPTFSPDGRWIAYGSNESGSWEVYVRAFPDDGRQVRVSVHGGRIPAWSRATNELLYETDDHRIMVVSYSVEGDAFVPKVPRAWSEARLGDTGVVANFDVAADGRSIAALVPAAADGSRRNEITFVTNFFDELERRAAAPTAP